MQCVANRCVNIDTEWFSGRHLRNRIRIQSQMHIHSQYLKF